jgi:hypothetical protein
MNAVHAELDRLSSLAAGLCLDARVRLEAGKGGWCYLPDRRVIRVDSRDLEHKGAIYCAGVLAHEVGHFHISRYHLFRVAFPSEQVLGQVLNGLEDPRVNTWIKERYPGTVPWFHKLGTVDGREPFTGLLPAVVRFSLEAAREELIGWDPATSVGPLPAAVADALEATRAARQRFARTLPPANLATDLAGDSLAERYRAEVLPRLVHSSALLPSPWEQICRVSVNEALAIAEADILPTAAALLRQDVARLASLLGRDARLEEEARQAVVGSDNVDPGRLVALSCALEEGTHPPHRLLPLAQDVIDAWLLRRTWVMLGCPTSRCAEPSRPLPIRETPLRPHSQALDDYESLREKLEAQIDRLVRDLEGVLRPRRRLRQRAGYPTGLRVDLRRAMAYEADPRVYDRLWSRPTIPQRRDTAFSLLVDLSGSMRGVKASAALDGTILLAETLHRLGVPFAINGFQDAVIPFGAFGAGLTPEMREAIATMPQEINGDRPGGNNHPGHNDDGPCVRTAAEELLDWAATEHVLLVVSDGLPEGRHSTPADLHSVIRDLSRVRGLKLVGIGLGSGTEHVTDFYPESVADVPTDQLAAQIGCLLRRNLIGG